jgi:hypothetical protein
MRFAIPIPRVSILRTLAVLLSITLLGNSIALADEPAANPAQLKKILISRGIGKGIWVKEIDGKTVKGTLTGIHEDSLDITPKHATQNQTIAYTQISDVQQTGMTADSKILIGIVAVVGLAVLVVAVALHVKAKAITPN